jgi:hypothetical protein
MLRWLGEIPVALCLRTIREMGGKSSAVVVLLFLLRVFLVLSL